MTQEASGDGRVRWVTALALVVAVVFLSALDALPLVTIPLAVVLAVLPSAQRWKWLALGAIIWLVGIGVPGGPLNQMSEIWALLLGGGYVAITLWRPRWGVLTRSLVGLAVAMTLGAAWFAITGGWVQMDSMVREQMLSVSSLALRELQPSGADSTAVTQFASTATRVATLQWKVFPALLGLQSLAALALVSWTVARLRRTEEGPFRLRPMREFRFNDQLVWILVVGLVLLVLPFGAVPVRMGYNALLFMGGLYALRGVGVFLFLVGTAPSALTIFFGALAAVFLYPVVLTAAVLVGLGDTWLDVRKRAAVAPRT